MTAIARPATARTAPRGVVTARVLLTAALTLASLSFIFLALSFSAPVPAFWGFRGGNAMLGVISAWMGYVVATGRPRNPIGWCFLAVGVAASLDSAALEYATLGLYGAASLPGAEIGAWIHDWIWPWYGVGIAIVFLHFPGGELPSRRWRAVIGFSAAAAALMMFVLAFTPGPLRTFGVENPIALQVLAPYADQLKTGPVAAVGISSLATSILIATAALVRRFIRSRGETRQQLKWLAMSALLMAASVVMTLAWGDTAKITQVATIVAFVSVPVTIAIAILRYRLYEIDTLINRAIVYGALTAVLAGVFAGSQEVLRRLFVGATGESSDAASVIALFIIATLFAPARSRLQKAVDTRFHSRATAPEATSAGVPTPELLRELAKLHAEGVLTDAEFTEKKKELLARL